jgi:hypothetical protein
MAWRADPLNRPRRTARHRPPFRAWPSRRARRRQLAPPRQAGPAGYAAGTLAMTESLPEPRMQSQ